MTDRDASSSPSDASVDPPRGQPLSTTGILVDAWRRLATTPSVPMAFLVAGGIVTGIDWVQLHDPVPTSEYDGIQQGRIAVMFPLVVRIISRATVPPSSLLHLKTRWVASTVGLDLLGVVAVVGASSYALARLLDVDLTIPAILRYGVLVVVLDVGIGHVTFEGESLLVGLLLLVAFLVVMGRLVPFPGRLVLGDRFGPALRWSWQATRGHGGALVGVVLVLGLVNHLLTSVPLVGPLGSAAVGVVHAGVVATIIVRVSSPQSSSTPR